MTRRQHWANLRERFERLRSNKIFEWTVIAIIILSALLIGAKTYDETTQFERILTVLDWGVTLFFLVELLIRLAAEKRPRDFFKNGWNVFDTVIVTASLIPIGGGDAVLLARLLRVLRMMRLISLIPELRILVSALIKAIPRMGYVALLMFIIFYIYAAVGSFIFQDVNPDRWGNIALAMLTLFQVATFESWATAVLYPTMEVYPWSWAFFVSFIFLTAFTFLNMMIGIVLDVMQKENAAYELEQGEGEAAEEQQLREDVAAMREQLARMEKLLEGAALSSGHDQAPAPAPAPAADPSAPR